MTHPKIRYYKELLSPIFTSANVVIILTRFSQETMDELAEKADVCFPSRFVILNITFQDDEQLTRILFDAKSKKLQTVNSHLGLEVDVLECVESVVNKVNLPLQPDEFLITL